MSFTKKDVEDILPLTHLQEGILFHYLKNLESNLYSIQLSIEIDGVVNLEYFQTAWNKVIEENEMLRTVYRWEKLNKPVQIILKKHNADIRYYDLSEKGNIDAEYELQDIKQKDYSKGFDLTEVPFRIILVKLHNNKYDLLISNHHIIYDGWSNGIILKEFQQYYNGLICKNLIENNRKNSFKNYIKLDKETSNKGELFWKNYLKEYEPKNAFIARNYNSFQSNYSNECFKFSIPENTFLILKHICELHKITIADILYGVWGILLCKYLGENDIVFGTTVSGRNIKLDDVERIVGLFINTIPIRIKISSDKTVISVIKESANNTLERREFENIPLHRILNYSASKENELFDSIFVVENYPLEKESFRLSNGVVFKSFSIKESTNYKLTISAFISNKIEICFNYLNTSFEKELIESIGKHYVRIINGIINDNNSDVFSLELLSDAEKHQLLYEFNDTKADYPKGTTIHQLFEKQVERTPANIALSLDNKEMTYMELNQKSNQLARVLRGKGVKPDDIVALMVERSFEMIIGIIGILKAGGAYLPIDPDYPEDRKVFMLNNSKAKLLLTSQVSNGDVDYKGEFLFLDNDEHYSNDAYNLALINSSKDLAYVIYTSGTTGQPKGVMIEHNNVVRLMFNDKFQFDFNESDVWTMFHSYCFDFSVWEMYGALLYGGKLVVIPKIVAKDASSYLRILKNQRVTILNQTPSAFYNLINEELNNEYNFWKIRNVIFGGEALSPIRLKSFKKKYPDAKIINMYGITETTVHVTFKEIGEYEIENNISNIGKPIPTLTTYILDKDRRLVPIGISGELCVGGLGVARGYLYNLELTKTKFIINPYNPEEKLYCSGDLARILPGGDMEYLGRIDHQVKIRGFRIELGEIENDILQFPAVKECVVISREDGLGDKYLCAYVVFNGEEKNLIPLLRTYLSGLLPDYMIPSYILKIDKIPLTSNGKIDRGSLPEPEVKAGSDYVAPSNVIESRLAKIWSEVLSIESKEISTNVSFFELGGHSLKVTILVSLIHKELDVRLELRDIFQYQTIQEQSRLIKSTDKTFYLSIPVSKTKEYYPLSSSQRRLYLLQQMDLDSVTYNMPGLIGVPKGHTKKRIIESFRELINRHESLRTSFESIDDLPIQRIHPEVLFNISEYRIKREELKKLQKDFIQPFDLGQAPLLRVGYVNIQDGDDCLLIDMHHIISDGRSHEILSEEFSQLLLGNYLPPLRLQYKDYSEWQNSKHQQDKIKEQEKYWIEKFANDLSVLDLPTDYTRPTIQNFSGASVQFLLSLEQTDIIRVLCREQGLTRYMSLLSIFTILLSKLSGQEDIIVGTPIAARRHTDLEGIVGMFVNTLAIRNNVSGYQPLKDYFQSFKENILEAYENQEYQFEDLVEKISVNRDAGRNPVFDVMFNMLNQKDIRGDLTELSDMELVHSLGISKFDLTLTAIDYGEQLLLTFEYCTKLFKPESIERFIKYFKRIVDLLNSKLDKEISELEILSSDEKHQLLYGFNDTECNYPKDKTIHQLFEEQVKKTPDGIVVVKDDLSLSYNELNIKSNQIAWSLIDVGIGTGNVVGLMAERTEFLIASILGILKSGAAYLPLNRDWPEERMNFMLSDSCCSVVLYDKKLGDFNNTNFNFLDIHDVNLYKRSSENLNIPIKSSNIIYIIYTSGTTGVPKGVLTTHSNVSRVVVNSNYISIDRSDRILQLSSYTFDGSVFDIYGVLLNGSSLIMINNDEILSIDKLLDIILRKQISIFFLTTALFNAIVDYGLSKLRDVNKILFGGERISKQHTHKAIQELGKDKLIHVYGPTETTVYASYHKIDIINEDRGTIPIGKPISNTTIYILDKHKRLVPKGTKGEIYIGGEGNALGYLNNVDLTMDKFIPNPFKKGQSLYRTGDVGLMLEDGSIEFVDRIDQQVKIRGFRIELGEIENILLKHENVRECTVLALEKEGDKYLCAYVVLKLGQPIEELRGYLLTYLPDYMVPSYFVELDKLPLTSNGKINRGALPFPEIRAGEGYVAPSNRIEEKLVVVWSEVLNISPEEISTMANFFQIGGHSLKASILTGRIHKEIGVEFPLRDVFLYPTVKAQASQIEVRGKKMFIPISNSDERDYYPLSSAQKRMYLLQQMDLGSMAYNMPYRIPLCEGVEKAKIKTVLNQLISRHGSFRTSFEIKGERAVQRIYEQVSFLVEEYTIESIEEEQSIRKQFVRPFDLTRAPLLRAAIVEVKGEGCFLMVDMHHIIGDGVSFSILERDFRTLYSGQELSPLRLQYKDYIEWQYSKEHQEKLIQQGLYWFKKFEEGVPVLDLPTDYLRPLIQSHEGATVNFALTQEETEGLRVLARKNELTLYMAILSTFAILLSKLSGQNDIIVGTPVAGRNHVDLGGIVGMFVNTLAIPIEAKGEDTLREFFGKLKQNTLGAFDNQDYPFEDLVEKVSVIRDASRNPLFDVMFNLLSQDDYSCDISVPDDEGFVHAQQISKFDLTLTAIDQGTQILLSFEYCTKLFEVTTIERIIKYFHQLVRQLSENSEAKLLTLDILPTAEKFELLHGFNNTSINWPKDKTIHQLFEEQVIKNPDRIALVHNDRAVSYRELNARSNQIGQLLLEQGLGIEDIVALFLDRGMEMPIAIMGVLKAGGAYLPIDTSYPLPRIKYIIENSGAILALTQNTYIDRIEGLLPISVIDEEKLHQDIPNLDIHISPSNLSYVIYTSGSTGNPKGVLVEHASVVNLLYFLQDNYPLKENESYLLKTSYSFDVSVSELFGWILGRGKLVILPQHSEKDPTAIMESVNTFGITHINFVPSVFKSFSHTIFLSNKHKLKTLKYVMIAGEALQPEHLTYFQELGLKTEIANLYGPTEATVYASFYKIPNVLSQKILIGKPLSNCTVYILGKNHQLQPIGVLGELCVGGMGLSRGYYRNVGLTTEKFVPNPYKKDERLYHTGDLARWLPDGNIEFFGRIDNQVKIRGFRIELGEIENALLKHENVRECIVLALEKDDDKYLCAYVVLKSGQSVEELREYLLAHLPDYMTPSYFVELDKLPLTSNGKVNRSALPSPEVKAGENYVAPSNGIEEKLVLIWSEILHVSSEKISTTANFFSIGGHSLKASILTGKVHKEIGVEFPLRDVFLYPTIKAQASQIEIRGKKTFTPIPNSYKRDYYPLSSAQKRLYLLQQMDLESTAYNMPYTLPLDIGVDKAIISKIFRQLISRHESFRTSFEIIGEEPVQRIHDNIELRVDEFTIEKVQEQEARHQFIRFFDLSRAPLLRAAIVNIKGECSMLMIDMHHIISDGVSYTILAKEFKELLEGKVLAPLHIHYRDYSEWLNSEEQQQKMKGQKDYWIQKFAGETPALNLPIDYARPSLQSYDGAYVRFSLSKEETEKLKDLARENGLTLYMTVLSVFNILLSKLSGQEDVIIGTPIAGRNHADLENVVGMFVNTLALWNVVHENYTIAEFAERLKTVTLEAFENQDYQFDDLVEQISVNRDISRNPLFDVMFDLTNQVEYYGDTTDLNADEYSHKSGVSKFDLSLSVVDNGDNFSCSLEYCTKLFKPETIDRIISYFKQIVKQLSDKFTEKISTLEIITEEEKQKLVYEFNNTRKNYPIDKAIHQLFEEQVEKHPFKVAIIYDDIQVTYNEINSRANRLAYTLREFGVKPNTIVALYGDRSPQMITSLIAVLKAGGAFLPIASSTVVNRCETILNESRTQLLLTQNSLVNEVMFSGKVVDVEDEEYYSDNITNLENVNSNSNLVYVIYTSGSSGNPKGVMIEHTSYANVHYAWKDKYGLTKEDINLLQLASFGFDVFAGDIARSLLNGGRLIICPDEIRLDFENLSKLLIKHRINIIESTPGLMIPLLEYGYNNGEFFKDLDLIIIGSDILSARDYIKIQSIFGKNKRIINSYGVTEAAIDTSFYEESQNIPQDGNLPIGKPMPNMSFYVLNSSNKLQPIGIAGELCIGGNGLALGYLNNPLLTSEKFTVNPLIAEERIYRTGDLARWLPDGNMEFLGRIDHQVKIRGFRIELGEIENQLLSIDKISEAVVVDREDESGQKNLWGYIVENQEISVGEIRQLLSKKIPDYMIPAYFVKVDKIPLTVNGKIDRVVLFKSKVEAESDYVAPRTEEERIIWEVWNSVLGVKQIGVNQNFFQIGGNSIKSIQISSRLHGLGYKISVKDIYTNPTVQELADIIRRSLDLVEYNEFNNLFTLSPIQKRYLTNSQDTYKYNQVRILKFSNRVSKETIQEITLKIIDFHDGLRLKINKSEPENKMQEFIQKFVNPVITETICWNSNDLNAKLIEIEENLKISLNIYDNPLEIVLLQSEDLSYLIIGAHYLLLDEYSWGVMLDDISNIYKESQDKPGLNHLSKKESLIEWLIDFENYKGSDRFKETKKYWDNYYNIHKDIYIHKKNRENDSISDYGIISMVVDKNQTQALLTQVNKTFNTNVNDIILVTLLLSLNDLLNWKKIAFDFEVNGRNELNYTKKTNNIIGQFTSIYPQIIELEDTNGDLAELIKKIKDTLNSIPNKGFDYLAYKYLNTNIYNKYEIAESIPSVSYKYITPEENKKYNYSFDVISNCYYNDTIPENDYDYSLKVAAYYQKDELKLDLYYNKSQFENKSLKQFEKIFYKNLNNISTYCISKKENEKTPSDFTYKLTNEEFKILKDQYSFIDIYPLSSLQEGMYFHYLLNPDSATFQPQVRLRLTGSLKINLLRSCLNELLIRYDILRTVFVHKGFIRPLQVVLDQNEMPFIYKDIRDEYRNGDKETVLNKYGDIDRHSFFDLNKDILIRVTILQLEDNEFEFIYTHHHILIDGWCLDTLSREFVDLYNEYVNNQKHQILPVNQFVNYINWLSGKNKEKAKNYWENYLKGYNSPATIPFKKNGNDSSYELQIIKLNLNQHTAHNCTSFAQSLGVTVSTLFQMVWGLLLCFYNNRFDVVFGSVVSGRPAELEGIETMLGLFMNTIPIRVNYNENICVDDLLKDLNKNMGEGEKYHFYSLAEIQSNSAIKRDLFDHYLVFQNISTADSDNRDGVNSKDELQNLKISHIRDYAHTNYDFGINILPGKEITLEFKFNTFIYNKEDIELISNHFNKILNIVISDSQKRIIEIESSFMSEFDDELKNIKLGKGIGLQNKIGALSNRSDHEKEALDIWTELS